MRHAYDLFCRHGVHPIGIDRIIEAAQVAKMTLYRGFGSKDSLVLATLERRRELWTAWLEESALNRVDSPAGALLALFDVLGEWFGRDDYESCYFTSVLLESHDRTSRVGAAAAEELIVVRRLVSELAEQAGIRDPDSFARKWQMLMLGACIAAAMGDQDAAESAREVAATYLERERSGSG